MSLHHMCDEDIIKIFVNEKGNLINSRISINYLKYHQDLKDYLDTRYNDSTKYSEIIYRIINHIDTKPVCKNCGKSVTFYKFSCGYHQFCCKTCIIKTQESINKAKETCKLRYGFENPMQNADIKNKSREKCFEKHGVYYTAQISESRLKYKQTCLEKYNVDNVSLLLSVKNLKKLIFLEKYGADSIMSTTYFKETRELTFLEKYGYTNPNKSDIVKQTISNTILLKYNYKHYFLTKDFKLKTLLFYNTNYGVDYNSLRPEVKEHLSQIMQSLEIQNKINQTKKINKSFNSSKIELLFEDYLKLNFPNDYVTLFRSELYPFNCDFYIKSLDLYIELLGSWTHGNHPYNENTPEDFNKLELWKLKNTNYYRNAIKTWTIRDVNKRNIAKENNLNYLEIFSNNIDICILKLNEYLNEFNRL